MRMMIQKMIRKQKIKKKKYKLKLVFKYYKYVKNINLNKYYKVYE